ncbi:MAG: hypothetical protein ACFFA1_08575 [Promethearchaeota archaeon]
MAETNEEASRKVFVKFLRRQWKMTLVIAGVIAAAAITALFVFLWVVADAQATGLVPATIGLWSVGSLITFILHVILWEFVFVGTWGIPIAALIYLLWWKKIPDEERREYVGEPEEKRRRMSAGRGGGFISFIVTVTWLIMIWINGRWNLAFQAWTFNDFVYSWIHAIAWDLLILGLPAAIFIIGYIVYAVRKEPKIEA